TLSAYPFPILLVLHRHKSSSPDLVKLMSRKEGVIVVEAEDGDEMKEGVMLLAPPDYHMVINPDGLVSLSLEEPVNYARPSIDVLFASAARAFGPRVVGVLFSGASRDGVDGLKEIRARGGVTIVQDPKTAESPFMPQTAVQEEAADLVLPPEGIVEKLKEFAGGGR
ncbi:MAG: chemotaxis protein CheB, partial [Deltaproteobacteria bacterium]